jgi:hypothetical protein
MSGRYPTDVIAQSRALLESWQSIDAQLKIGPLTPEALAGQLDKAEPIEKQIARLEGQLTDLRNQRDALYCDLWDFVTRVRGGIRSIYGRDSSQYEMVGGTRLSERKPAARKPKSG